MGRNWNSHDFLKELKEAGNALFDAFTPFLMLALMVGITLLPFAIIGWLLTH